MIEESVSSSSPALLSIEGARVRFGGFHAVSDISLELHPGHLLGLIGPNGAGKTTLLRAAAGLQPMSRGRVRVLGEERNGSMMGSIGFTPDTPVFYDTLTVRQFLRFIGKGYGLVGNEIDERIDFWLEKVWLSEKAEQKVKGLSRGMKQRLGIARTLLPNPAVVLLDEPAAGLDPAGRGQFRQLLCDLRDQGKALIVSSHILADMAEYCTHIGIMSAGEMVKHGTVGEVSSSAQGSRRRYAITLCRAMTGLHETLGAIEGVSGLNIDGDRITLEYESDREKAAGLLVALVRERIPVAAFTANDAGLEEAYLRSGIRQVD